jgi:phosphoglycolate phosphatase-like HAD superfamily hydrolase
VPVVVISDAGEELIAASLKQAGIRHLVKGLYHAANASEPLGDGRQRKRLDVPLKDFGVPAAQAVFIGDSPFDAQAAQHYGLPFIRVPRGDDTAFTFTNLITGPSRYRSADFSNLLQERYQDKPKA